MSLSDEEQIVATPYDSGTKHETLKRGNIKVTTINKEEAGLEDSHLSVFLEVSGAGYKNERPGVDIVTVLDVGESMKGEKLETLKGIMRLLIDKLSSADRLSIVTISKNPQKLCGLRQMSLVSQAEIEKLVSDLETHPGKDVNGGLEMAYKVINDRKYATGRQAAILLMSDGYQFHVPIKHTFVESVPVYTFGIGGDLNSMVLKDVAKSSDGGIHCSIDVASSSPSNLRSAVAECFAKLFTVVVSDLKLTVRRAKSMALIDNIYVGTYSRSDILLTALDDNVIVSFGDLYANETCKVEVDLHLSRVTTQQPCDLLHFSYSWSTMGVGFNSSSRLVRVTRVANLIGEGVSEEEKDEIGRRVLDLVKIRRLFNRIFASLVNLFWFLVSPFGGLGTSLQSRVEGSNDEIESETSNKLLIKGWWLQLTNISSCIYKFSILPLLSFLTLVSERTEDMWNCFTTVLIGFWGSMKSEAGNNGVLAMKNDPSRAMSLKGFGSQVIGVSFRIFKYLTALVIVFLILYGMSKQIGRKRPIEPIVKPIDVSPIINKDIQSPVTDLMVYYCNSHVGILSDHLKKALDSVTILREISNYVKQQIKFQAYEGQSSDLFRSRTVKALGEHIHLTFEWSKAIKKVLYNAESNRLCEKISEIRNINDKPINDKPEEDESNNRKYRVCLFLLLASLVGIRLNKFSFQSLQDYLTYVSTSIQSKLKILTRTKEPVDANTREPGGPSRIDDKPLGTEPTDDPQKVNDTPVKPEPIDSPTVITNKPLGAEPTDDLQKVNDKPVKPEPFDTPIVIIDKPLKVISREETMKIMTDRIKQAFDSIKVIRGILNDYVKQHTEFEANSNNSKDSVRSGNVKALGDHIQKTFNSVETIENILKQCTT